MVDSDLFPLCVRYIIGPRDDVQLGFRLISLMILLHCFIWVCSVNGDLHVLQMSEQSDLSDFPSDPYGSYRFAKQVFNRWMA